MTKDCWHWINIKKEFWRLCVWNDFNEKTRWWKM